MKELTKQEKQELQEHYEWLINGGGKKLDWSGKDLSDTNLSDTNLSRANLTNADLSDTNLTNATGLIKIIGVEPSNYYWKRIDKMFSSNDYYFTVGLNKLRDGEVFASDEKVLCSYPGFHFASRSWCARNYSERRYEVKIQIPKNAKINEPWATDGKASADMIKIVQVIDSTTGEDVTEKFKNYADGKGNRIKNDKIQKIS